MTESQDKLVYIGFLEVYREEDNQNNWNKNRTRHLQTEN